MKKILTAFLLILCIIPTSFADTDPDTTNKKLITAKGYVVDDVELALPGAIISQTNDPHSNHTSSDENGFFKLPKEIAIGTNISIYNSGYVTQTVQINDESDVKIIMEPDQANQIDSVTIKLNKPCADDNKLQEWFAIGAKWIESSTYKEDEKLKCIPTKCIDGYTLENGDTENAQCIFKKDTPCEISGIDNSVSRGVYVLLSDKSAICQPECYENYAPTLENKTYTCKQTSTDCSETIKQTIKSNVSTATDFEAVHWNESTGQIDKCEITTCSGELVPNKDGTSCINKKCGCGQEWNSEKELCEKKTDRTCVSDDKNATKSEDMCKKADGSSAQTCEIGDGCTQFCKIITCDENNGYTVDTTNNKCVCDERTHTEKGGKCEVKMLLSEEDHKQQIEELTKNADAMREKETSLASRITDAVGIGGTGIGGAMVGAALSERAADSDAESAMRGYLNSFRCEYGNGQSITYGDTGIELPGGNDMVGLYTQYVQLANDLKIRKESLGLRPGIESEVVLDKANMGLYDDTSVGITGGTYASISRALTNPNGDDATRLAEQRESTNKNLTTGAIVAGGSAIASGVSNIVNNSKNPDRSKEIIKKYDAKRKAATSSGTK